MFHVRVMPRDTCHKEITDALSHVPPQIPLLYTSFGYVVGVLTNDSQISSEFSAVEAPLLLRSSLKQLVHNLCSGAIRFLFRGFEQRLCHIRRALNVSTEDSFQIDLEIHSHLHIAACGTDTPVVTPIDCKRASGASFDATDLFCQIFHSGRRGQGVDDERYVWMVQ